MKLNKSSVFFSLFFFSRPLSKWSAAPGRGEILSVCVHVGICVLVIDACQVHGLLSLTILVKMYINALGIF